MNQESTSVSLKLNHRASKPSPTANAGIFRMSLANIVILLQNAMWRTANVATVGDNKMKWHKMSKKSLMGRIIVLPVFIIILVVELILNKAYDWSYSIRRLRIRMTDWIDKKFPLG